MTDNQILNLAKRYSEALDKAELARQVAKRSLGYLDIVGSVDGAVTLAAYIAVHSPGALKGGARDEAAAIVDLALGAPDKVYALLFPGEERETLRAAAREAGDETGEDNTGDVKSA